MLEDKVKEAEQVLKLAADMSKAYYNKPLIVSYSGGKDSDVMLDIAKRCLDPDTFEVVNNHTTVDAPETVYHIRKVFADCETRGIHTEVLRPEFRGERTSMWKLIELNGVPPTRLARYCCRILKERTIPDRMIAIGVREAESVGRQGKDSFAIRGKTKEDAEYRSLQHTYAMFKLDQMGKEDAYECVFIQACKANKSTIVNPIYHFTDSEIWEYVRTYNVPMNPLYQRGYKRVGCIGCPLGGGNQQRQQFADFPQYKKNYIRALDRTIAKRKAEGKKNTYKDGEEWLRWWTGEDINQIRIEDLLNEMKGNENELSERNNAGAKPDGG